MNGKKAKAIRKFVKGMVGAEKIEAVYDVKEDARIRQGGIGPDGKPELQRVVTNVHTLQGGCTRKQYKSVKKILKTKAA